jgi:hypothetical protein
MKDSISEGGEYPFNQYGPFWTYPFLVVSFFVSDDYLFLVMRIMTISFYMLSAYILYKISKFFLQASAAWIPAALFLCAQPFVSDIGSDLVTWPSAVVMPLVLLVFYNSMLVMRGNYSWRISIFLGLLLPAILLTRVQIGVLTTVAVGVVLILCNKFIVSSWFAVGFIASVITNIAFLAKLGWLNSALYDQFVFGLTYLAADKSTFPKPVFTLIGIILVVLFLSLVPRVRNLRGLSVKNRIILSFVTTLLSFTLIATIINRELDLLQSQVLISRRAWIVIVLGSLVFFILSLGFETLKRPGKIQSFVRQKSDLLVLALFAVALQSQVYPLFDQMHFWWGSPISFLILTMVSKNVLKDLSIPKKNARVLMFFVTLLLVFSILFPWFSQISKEKFEYPHEIGSNIFSSSSAVSEEKKLQDFFQAYLPSGATILNLCENANVFFSSPKYHSSSRFFVFWADQMSHADRIFEDMRSSRPDYIVSCDLTHVPDLRLSQESIRDQLIESLTMKKILISSYVGEEKKHWFIYQTQ